MRLGADAKKLQAYCFRYGVIFGYYGVSRPPLSVRLPGQTDGLAADS
jgi:hypothetical protein